MDFCRRFFGPSPKSAVGAASHPGAEKRAVAATAPSQANMERRTFDAMGLDLGFWLGMLNVSVETGSIHAMPPGKLRQLVDHVRELQTGLGLTSEIDSRRGIDPIKEEVDRSCSPSCKILFKIGLILGDLGNPQRPVRDSREIDILRTFLGCLQLPCSLLDPLSQALLRNPPPSEAFNVALSKVHRDIAAALNAP